MSGPVKDMADSTNAAGFKGEVGRLSGFTSAEQPGDRVERATAVGKVGAANEEIGRRPSRRDRKTSAVSTIPEAICLPGGLRGCFNRGIATAGQSAVEARWARSPLLLSGILPGGLTPSADSATIRPSWQRFEFSPG